MFRYFRAIVVNGTIYECGSQFQIDCTNVQIIGTETIDVLGTDTELFHVNYLGLDYFLDITEEEFTSTCAGCYTPCFDLITAESGDLLGWDGVNKKIVPATPAGTFPTNNSYDVIRFNLTQDVGTNDFTGTVVAPAITPSLYLQGVAYIFVFPAGITNNGAASVRIRATSGLAYLTVKAPNGTTSISITQVAAGSEYFGGYNGTNLVGQRTFGGITSYPIPIVDGGTGQITANAAFNALAPSQATNAGKFLTTDGSNTSWVAVNIPTGTSAQTLRFDGTNTLVATSRLTNDGTTIVSKGTDSSGATKNYEWQDTAGAVLFQIFNSGTAKFPVNGKDIYFGTGSILTTGSGNTSTLLSGFGLYNALLINDLDANHTNIIRVNVQSIGTGSISPTGGSDVIAILNTNTAGTNTADTALLYGADAAGGNACLATKTELGHVIKLFANTGWTASTVSTTLKTGLSDASTLANVLAWAQAIENHIFGGMGILHA